MFYDAVANDHGLPHDPFKGLVVPRPIGWISTLDARGRVNLAPYSFFNAVSFQPNIVAFSSTNYKDSSGNADACGEFVCNFVTSDLREAMNATAAPEPHGVDEMALAGLTAAPCRFVRPPRVAESPVALECRLLQTIELRDLNGEPANHWLTLGQVVGVHIDDSMIVDGLVDARRLKPIARLGYMDYSVLTETFAMTRPKAREAAK